MKTSETISTLATALSSAQGELTNVGKGRFNQHFKSSYADIGDGLEVVRPVFAKHGLSVVQATDYNPDTGVFVLITRILHKSGEWIESVYPLPTSGKIQEQGSAITYARRYSLFSLAGVAAAEEDDDGNSAQNATPAAKRSAPRPAPPAPKPAAPVELLPEEDSETVCQTMIGTLDLIDAIEDLREWASSNAGTKAKLQAHHQGLVTDAFTKAQKRIREAVSA